MRRKSGTIILFVAVLLPIIFFLLSLTIDFSVLVDAYHDTHKHLDLSNQNLIRNQGSSKVVNSENFHISSIPAQKFTSYFNESIIEMPTKTSVRRSSQNMQLITDFDVPYSLKLADFYEQDCENINLIRLKSTLYWLLKFGADANQNFNFSIKSDGVIKDIIWGNLFDSNQKVNIDSHCLNKTLIGLNQSMDCIGVFSVPSTNQEVVCSLFSTKFSFVDESFDNLISDVLVKNLFFQLLESLYEINKIIIFTTNKITEDNILTKIKEELVKLERLPWKTVVVLVSYAPSIEGEFPTEAVRIESNKVRFIRLAPSSYNWGSSLAAKLMDLEVEWLVSQ